MQRYAAYEIAEIHRKRRGIEPDRPQLRTHLLQVRWPTRQRHLDERAAYLRITEELHQLRLDQLDGDASLRVDLIQRSGKRRVEGRANRALLLRPERKLFEPWSRGFENRAGQP